MKPTIGRIVHFQTLDGQTLPAIVTRVFSDTCVNLEVFGVNTESRFPTSVCMGGESGEWSWPPRVS